MTSFNMLKQMRFLRFSQCWFVLCMALPLSTVAAREVPFLSGHVVDDAALLTNETRSELEQLLTIHEDQTSNQVVVLIIDSLDDEVLEEYSLKVAESWKIGQADKDNGVLLLVAVQDRKLRIEVGYGLEGDLPDVLCSQIIRREIVPRFREGEFDAGVRAGVLTILAAIEGSYTASPEDAAAEEIPLFGVLLTAFVFLVVVGLFTFFAVFDRGWFLYLFLIPFYAAFPWVFLPYQLAIALFVLYVVALPILRLVLPRTDWGKRKYTAIQSGIASSGSSSGFSSSGFSGGGGSFGGGGSSGSW